MNPHCRIGRVRLKAHPGVRVIVGGRAASMSGVKKLLSSMLARADDFDSVVVLARDEHGVWDASWASMTISDLVYAHRILDARIWAELAKIGEAE